MSFIANNRLLWLCLAFLILVNILLLGRALYNRLPPAPAQITLSERELESPYRYNFNRENSAMRLQLRWRAAYNPARDDITNWWGYNAVLSLNSDEFAHLQFAACDPEQYHPRDSRKGWVLMELNGAALREYQQALSESLAKHIAQEPSEKDYSWTHTRDSLEERLKAAQTTDTRLFAVSASVNRETLVAEQQTRQAANQQASYIILPGELRDTYERCSGQEPQRPSATTQVMLVLPNEDFHVANTFTQAQAEQKQYSLVLSLGRLNELWLSDIQQP